MAGNSNNIIRAARASQFTVLNNDLVSDPRLSMESLGLLVRILSKPDNWRCNSTQLASEFGCGRERVRSAMNRLQECGYVQRTTRNGEKGRITTVWLVSEEGNMTNRVTGKPSDGYTGVGTPGVGQSGVGDPVSLINTEVTKTERTKTKGDKPREDGCASSAVEAENVAEAAFQKACKETLRSYGYAYESRYGTDPVVNAKLRSQIREFVKRIGQEEAPKVAAFFLKCDDAFFARMRHSFDVLLKQAEAITSRFRTNAVSTDAAVRGAQSGFDRNSAMVYEAITGGIGGCNDRA
jgi:hypothetical protein